MATASTPVARTVPTPVAGVVSYKPSANDIYGNDEQYLFAQTALVGFSLIELMLAMTIGLLILAGLTTVFVNSSQSYGELRKTAEQIENGRYAIEYIAQDLRHAGFYGEFAALPDAPTAGAVSILVRAEHRGEEIDPATWASVSPLQ